MASIVALKIIQMFIILSVGVIAFKTGLIDKSATAKMSNLLLMVISPMLSFMSYQTDFSAELLHGLLLCLLASVLTFVISILLSELIFRPGHASRAVSPDVSGLADGADASGLSDGTGSSSDLSGIEKLSVVYSNCGFIGVPLVNSLFGSIGVFYLTAYLTAFNVLLWTHGIRAMGETFTLKTLWKKLMTPAILAIAAGVVCFVAQIRLPEVLSYPLGLIANMNTPLAMLVAGANLAQADILKCLKKPRVYLVSVVRLILIPAISLIFLRMMHLDFTVSFTVFLAAACPAGASAIMFAERFGKDSSYATELFVLTTVLSVVTIPLISIPAVALLAHL